MQDSLNYIAAGKMLLDAVSPVDTERVPLDKCSGRVLAEELVSAVNVPPFDRSAYDGYALRAEDSAAASKAVPVLLRIVEEIPAGSVPTVVLTKGAAAKILTGAPIPSGADAVIMFEKTRFTKEAVEIFAPLKSGDNIVLAGEDVREGELLAKAGEVIDPGLAGTLAAQGVTRPAVYRVPRVAVISTGSEVLEAEDELSSGKIRNSNRYMLDAAIRALGCEPVYLGTAGDSVEDICTLIEGGLKSCDALVSTGGVSVGDYDLTPEAMLKAGAKMLFHGVDMKPGMSCAYGVCRGKIICALSGNPASAITNFYAITAPALKKLAGRRDYELKEIRLCLLDGFKKKSPRTRLLRGKLEIIEDRLSIRLPKAQGNAVLSSTIGCNAIAVIPAGSGPVEAGTILKGFLL